MKPFYKNPAAKYFYTRLQQAKAWRDKLDNGIITPPPLGNPYITSYDYERYRKAKKRRY